MHALMPMTAEFGLPQWLLGMSTYAFAGPERIVCTYSQGGLGFIGVLDLANEILTRVAMPFTEFGSVRVVGDRAVFRAGVRPIIPPASWHSISPPASTPC